MNLSEFKNELERRRTNRQDIVTTGYEAVQLPKDASVGIRIEDHDEYPLTHHAHTQLATQARIPMQYYEKLTRESPRLLCENLNLGSPYRTLLFRILDGAIVAIMSDQYRIIDNDTVFEEVCNNLSDSYHNLDVHQCSLTDSRMYVTSLEPTFAFAMRNDDVVPGVIVRNSETGEGAFRADMYLHIKDADVGLIGDNHADACEHEQDHRKAARNHYPGYNRVRHPELQWSDPSQAHR